MSNVIDEKVVEMRFDNKNFETNIKDTMKTLEAFKKQLQFSGASEGLEEINNCVKKINFNGLDKAIDTVNDRFSALGIIGVTALQNITNSAIEAGKKIVSALTIDPIKTGFSEYEQKMDAVRVIMASTNEPLEKVNKKIQELNKYADDTIYSFADMTTNIGKFTNAGVGLDDAVLAIKGVSNEAARSGANANEASRAMYNFAQALSMGYVQLIDWKSIENANMATVEFKKELLDTALSMNIVTKSADGMYKAGGKTYNMQQMFKDGLKEQWLTSNVLIDTLKRYADTTTDIGKKSQEAATQVSTVTKLWDTLREAAQSGWGNTWEIIIGDLDQAKITLTRVSNFISNIINSFAEARNKLLSSALGKSFKGLVDNIKESSESIQEVVESVKDYANIVDEIIAGKWGDGESRWNKLTEAGYDWAHAQNLVNERLGSSIRHATDFSEKQQQVVQTEKETIDITSKYIAELSKLSDAELKAKGYSNEQISSLNELKNVSNKLGISIEELIDKSDEINGRYLLIESFANIGRSLITIFSSLGKAFKDAFPPMTADTLFDIIAGMYKLSNIIKKYVDRNAENLTRTFRGLFSILSVVSNIIKGVLKVEFKALEVILGVFGKTSEGVLGVTANLGDILTTISNILNKYIIATFDKVINLMDLAINTIKEFISNNKIFITINEALNNVIIFIKNNITLLISQLKEWFKNNNLLNNIIETLSNTIFIITNRIKELFENNERLKETFENIKNKIDDAKKSLIEWIEKLKDGNIGKNIIDGLGKGLEYGISKIINIIIKIATKIKETFCKLFGINSPSKTFYDYGVYIVEGLINGIKSMFPNIKQIFKNIYNTIKNISFENVSAIIWPLTSIVPQLKFLELPRQFLNLFKACGINSLEGLKIGLQGSNGVLDTITTLAKKIIDKFKSIFQINSPSKVFIAIGGFIISGLIIGLKDSFPKVNDTIKSLFDSIINFVKSIDFGKILAIGLGAGLIFTVNNIMKTLNKFANLANRITSPLKGLGDALSGIGKMFSDKGEAEKTKAKGESIRNMSLSLLIIAGSVYLLGKMDTSQLIKGGVAIGIITIVVAALYGFIYFISSKFNNINIMSINGSINNLIKVSGSILLLALALHLISKIQINENLITTFGILTAILLGYMKLIQTSMLAGPNASAAGSMLLKIAASLLIITKVIKIIGKMDETELSKGLIVITMISGIFSALIIVSSIAGQFSKDAGSMISKISVSILLIIAAIKLINSMTIGEIAKGLGVIAGIGLLFKALIAISKDAGQFSKDAGSMLLKISVSILLIIAAIKLINSMTIGEIAKGLGVIAGIGLLFKALIAISKDAGPNAVKAGLMLVEAAGALLLVVGALFILTKIDDKNLWRSVGIIAILEALFAGLIYVTKFAQDVKGTIITIGLCITLLIGSVALLTFLDQDKLINSTKCVSLLIGAISVLVTVTKFAGSIGKTIAALASITVAILALAGILILMEKMELESALENAEALSLLLIAMSAALGILTLIGLAGPAAFIGVGALDTLIVSLSAILTGIGVLVSKFPQLEEFIDKGGEIFEKIGKILGSFVGNIIGGFGEALSNSLPDIATNLSKFMDNLSGFIEGAKGIDADVLNGIKILSEAIITLTAANLLQGITKFLSFGKDNKFDNFGKQLEGLGTGLNTFVSKLTNFDDTSKSKIEAACEVIKLLGEANNSVPNSGGLLSKIIGDNKLEDFGKQLEGLGTGLNTFVSKLTNFDDNSKSKIEAACEVIKLLGEANNSVPNSGGLLSKIIGDNKLDDFGEQLEGLGKGINSFVVSLKDFSKEKIEIVKSACDSIFDIAGLGDMDLNTISSNLKVFGDSLIYFGYDLEQFLICISDLGTDTISQCISKVQELINMANNIASINIESITTFSQSLVETANNGVIEFCNAFSGFEPVEKVKSSIRIMLEAALSEADNKKEKFKTTFTELMKKGIEGVESKKGQMINVFKDTCKTIIDNIRSERPNMVSAGEYFADGFANGINNNAYKGIEAARNMAIQALIATKQAIDSNSPSKETQKIGNFFGEGFVNGMKDYFSKIYNTAFNTGELAKNGLNEAISKIKYIINNDMDLQPRITPILDLSNIRSGINDINSMFNYDNLNRNLSAISNVNIGNQNRRNDDVVSAINKLSDSLNSYNGNIINIYPQELDKDSLNEIVDEVNRNFGKVYK